MSEALRLVTVDVVLQRAPEPSPFWFLWSRTRRAERFDGFERDARAETGVDADCISVRPAYRCEADAAKVAISIMRHWPGLRVFVCPGDDSWGPTFSPVAHIEVTAALLPPEGTAGEAR